MTSEEIAAKAGEADERSRSNERRIKRLEDTVDAIHELATNVALLAHGLERQDKDIKEIKADVQTLKAVPAKRWEQVVEKVFFGAVGALVGALVAFLFKGL